jgi:nitrous oxidase accessory protein NosD
MIVFEALAAIAASLVRAPAKDVHFWIRPATGDVITGPEMHSELVERHWVEMGLPEDQTHSMHDAIAHGWTRVRITAEAAIIHGSSLRDARRVLTHLLDHSVVFERPVTISIEPTNIVRHRTLGKWVAVADLAKTQSFQIRGFEDAERFARGVTRLGGTGDAAALC